MRSEPKFYLKSNKSINKTPIILNLKIHNENFRYSIKKSILPELWDKSTQRPTKDKKIISEYKKHSSTIKEDLKDITNRILNVEKATITFLNECEQKDEIVDLNKLKEILDIKFSNVISTKKEPNKIELNDYIEKFIEGIESGTITINSGSNYGKKYKSSTVKTWKEWNTQFLEFQKKHKKLTWESINMDVYDNLINYFYLKEYSVNSVGKIIKNLIAILNRSYDNSIHTNQISKNKEFKVITEEIDKVTLTSEELDSLYKIDLSKNKDYDFHRNIFLIGCYTALRISDIARIKKSHIIEKDKKKYIKIRTKKTDGEVIIPINTRLEAILKKYDYKIPTINIQKLRKNIKEICKKIKMNDEVEIKSSKGGTTKYTTHRKYELVSAHTSRRTGATLMFLSGIKPLLIRRITGHKKESTFMKYINISQDEVAELVSNNPYFK